MGIPRLKNNRTAARRKVDLAVKYKKQGKATGGGRTNIKKVRRTLEARNLPTMRAKANPSGEQRRGRHKTNKKT